MRVFAFAIFITLSPPLLAEDNRSSEVQPVVEEKNTVYGDESKEKSGSNADEEILLKLTVRDFKALIEAIEADKPDNEQAAYRYNLECDDPGLSYADLMSCQDLKAQQEMARGTSDIRDYTGTTVTISWWALGLLFASLVAAAVAAYYSRKLTINDFSRTEVELQPYFRIRLSSLSVNSVFSDGTRYDAFTIVVSIQNIGKAPATSVMLEFDGDRRSIIVLYPSPNETGIGTSQTPYRVTERGLATNEIITSDAPQTFRFPVTTDQPPPVPLTRNQYLINLSGLVIRYKDFTCDKSDTHKTAMCDFSVSRNIDPSADGGFRINGVTRVSQYGKEEKDVDHPRYQRFLQPPEAPD